MGDWGKDEVEVKGHATVQVVSHEPPAAMS